MKKKYIIIASASSLALAMATARYTGAIGKIRRYLFLFNYDLVIIDIDGKNENIVSTSLDNFIEKKFNVDKFANEIETPKRLKYKYYKAPIKDAKKIITQGGLSFWENQKLIFIKKTKEGNNLIALENAASKDILNVLNRLFTS